MMIAAAAVAALVAGGVALTALRERPTNTVPITVTKEGSAERELFLLTSLPLVFGETFGLDTGSAALTRLERSFKVTPVAAAERARLGAGALLLMAHPRAQPAEQLVELDGWVRSGGRVLLLADPALKWPSEKALGDVTRPPPSFADTGLLQHWGLRLSGPEPDGPAQRTIDGKTIMAAAPGRLVALPGSACTIGDDGFVARCAIGTGRVVIIADADFLNVAGEGALDGPTDGNLDALVATLDALATH